MDISEKSPNGRFAPFTRREVQVAGDFSRTFFVGVVLVGVFAVSGAFGTYNNLSFAQRLVYWTIAVGGIGPAMQTMIGLSLTTPLLGSVHPLVRLVVGSMAAALPSTGIMFFLQAIFRPQQETLPILPWIWLSIAIVGVAVGAVQFFMLRGWNRSTVPPVAAPVPEEPEAVTPQTTPPAFFARLSPELGTDLISLSMHDHYLEVVTSAGKDLLRMRMADAVLELGDFPGASVHRSHWVALAHAISVRRTGSRAELVVSDGRRLPVSRSKLAETQALIDGRV